MKREFIDPSTTTEADRALRLRKDLADAQAKLREAEQWREQAAKAARLECELADAQAKLREAEQRNNRLSKRPSRRQLREAEGRAAEADALREQASKASKLERELADAREKLREAEGQVERLSKRPSRRQLQEAEEKLAAMETRLRDRPPPTPRHVERCAQAKLNRRLFQENERLKQEAQHGG